MYTHKHQSKSNCTCKQSFSATPVNTTRRLIRSASRFILRATGGSAISWPSSTITTSASHIALHIDSDDDCTVAKLARSMPPLFFHSRTDNGSSWLESVWSTPESITLSIGRIGTRRIGTYDLCWCFFVGVVSSKFQTRDCCTRHGWWVSVAMLFVSSLRGYYINLLFSDLYTCVC